MESNAGVDARVGVASCAPLKRTRIAVAASAKTVEVTKRRIVMRGKVRRSGCTARHLNAQREHERREELLGRGESRFLESRIGGEQSMEGGIDLGGGPAGCVLRPRVHRFAPRPKRECAGILEQCHQFVEQSAG